MAESKRSRDISAEYMQETLGVYNELGLDAARSIADETDDLWEKFKQTAVYTNAMYYLARMAAEAIRSHDTRRVHVQGEVVQAMMFHLGYTLGLAKGRQDAEVEQLERLRGEADGKVEG